MKVWYNPQSNELALQDIGWWLFWTEHFPNGNLHFKPRYPWRAIGIP